MDLRAVRLSEGWPVTRRGIPRRGIPRRGIIRRRAAAERDRAAGESLFRGVLDGLLDHAVLAEPTTDATGTVTDFRVVHVNRAAGTWGVPMAAMLRERLVTAGIGWMHDRFAQAFSTGEPVILDDCPVRHPDGSDHWTDVRAVRVEGVLFVSWRDVTARRRAEVALADSENRFRTAFDEGPVGIALQSLRPGRVGEFVQVNEAFEQLLGWRAEHVVGSGGDRLVHPDDLPEYRYELQALADAARRRYQRELRMLRHDGGYTWVRMTAAAMDHDGRPASLIAHLEDVTVRRTAEQHLAHRALHDPLTGLANRTLLRDHLRIAVSELARVPGTLAVFYLDLDRFKDVNDTLGHDAGDDVIRTVGARLAAGVRAPDTAARLAGDEFVVCARVHDDAQAARLADRLFRALSEPMTVRDRQVQPRPSIGVTTTSAGGADPDELLRQADAAMYQAKRGGRKPWVVYDEALHRRALERLAVEDDLRRALAEGHLRLLYQPIIDLSDRRIVSAEALLRLDHPTRGLLAPEAFIDVAEESDVIVPIGGWVLREACRHLAEWRRHAPWMQVAVNVSARQVSHLAVRDQVHAATAAAGLAPSGVLLEITERVLMDAGAAALDQLRGVTADGCGLAIDDFGTGYSSLAYLKRFPVSTVKIDRSFVSGLSAGSDDLAIVEAVTGLARTLRLTAVAEGVESKAQLRTLVALGCHRAQGFHIGAPMPAEELTALLARTAGPDG